MAFLDVFPEFFIPKWHLRYIGSYIRPLYPIRKS